MAASRTYRLPWTELDPARIESAAAAVATELGGLRFETEAHSPTDIRCFFHVPRAVARLREGPDFEEWFARPYLPPEPLPVEVEFLQLPADPGSPRPVCLVEIDSAHSATGICWETAKEILARLCRHAGGPCEEL